MLYAREKSETFYKSRQDIYLSEIKNSENRSMYVYIKCANLLSKCPIQDIFHIPFDIQPLAKEKLQNGVSITDSITFLMLYCFKEAPN